MDEIKEYTEKVFEDIKRINKEGNEYWLARELGKDVRKFIITIN